MGPSLFLFNSLIGSKKVKFWWQISKLQRVCCVTKQFVLLREGWVKSTFKKKIKRPKIRDHDSYGVTTKTICPGLCTECGRPLQSGYYPNELCKSHWPTFHVNAITCNISFSEFSLALSLSLGKR